MRVGTDIIPGLDRRASLQTHLFEDRVKKMSTVTIGSESTVGSRAVVLYDAEVGQCGLDSLSLVVKGERLPAGSRWRVIPAQLAE